MPQWNRARRLTTIAPALQTRHQLRIPTACTTRGVGQWGRLLLRLRPRGSRRWHARDSRAWRWVCWMTPMNTHRTKRCTAIVTRAPWTKVHANGARRVHTCRGSTCSYSPRVALGWQEHGRALIKNVFGYFAIRARIHTQKKRTCFCQPRSFLYELFPGPIAVWLILILERSHMQAVNRDLSPCAPSCSRVGATAHGLMKPRTTCVTNPIPYTRVLWERACVFLRERVAQHKTSHAMPCTP